MKTFHIRMTGPQRHKTYCGATPTQHDILASWRRTRSAATNRGV